MTLLEPMATITAGAVTLPPLVLLYLLKLRRRPLRVSSTLFWQSAIHDLQANVPLRWLRPSLLLLLHLAILGLLVTALGRPAIVPAGASSRRVVLLIDRSASMAAADAPGAISRLQAAKNSARDIVEHSSDSGSASIALVSFAAEARALTGFTDDRSALLDAISSLPQTDQPGDLAGALKLVEALLAGNRDETESTALPTVVLLSDGSFEPGPLALGGARFSFVRVGPPDTVATGPDNLGIVALAARRDYDDPATVRLFARIENASRSPRTVPVSLTLGDTVIERRALAIPGASAEGPAEAAASFELKSPAGGVAVVAIERPDLLSSDNSAAIVLPPARRPRIVLVTPDEAPATPPVPTDLISAETLLTDAASELDSSSFVRLDRSHYESIAEQGRPAAAGLYIFDRVTPSVLPAAPSLSFGAPLPIPGLEMTPPATPAPTYILSWTRTHPALRDVALDTVYVAASMHIAWPGAPGVAPPRVTELATGADGPLMIQVQDGPFRRLAVGFEIARSNWPLQVGFPVFLAAASDFLTMRADESAGKAFTSAQSVEVLPPERAERFELRGPVNIPVAVPPPTPGQLPGDLSPAAVGRIERAGVYRVEPQGPELFVAVNLCNPTETALAVAESVEVGGRAVAAAGEGSVSREIWPWFVFGAGALLMVEWVVYAWRMRI